MSPENQSLSDSTTLCAKLSVSKDELLKREQREQDQKKREE